MAITILQQDIDSCREAAREAIRKARLPEATKAAAPGTYGLTKVGLEILEAIEAALAAGLAVEAGLLARVAKDRAQGFAAGVATDGEKGFAATLGVLVAAEEALAATAGEDAAALPDKPFPAADVAALLAPSGWAEAICRDLAGYLEHYRAHADEARRLGDDRRLRACARSHLTRLALAARAAAGAAAHTHLRDALAAAPLRLPAVAWAGLERRAQADEDGDEDQLLDVRPEDIVGNADVLAAGLKLARAVAAFDVAAGVNPRVVDNPVLFVLGAPGCGKTATAHAVGRAFLDMCREAGVPGRFRVIRKTDWASHYQNKSSADLLRIFRDEVFGFHGVCGCYWPDIDTAFAARGDPDLRAEEKANLGTLFGILDGTVGPRNGRWFLMCDANYMQMDDAMASRLTQDPKLARGPETPAEYVRLLRDIKLRAFAELVPTDAAAWDDIGARLVAARLSGRAVAAVAGRVTAELQDVPEPAGFLATSLDEKRRALRALARPIAKERIIEQIEHYRRFEQEAADRAHRERFDCRVEEIRLQLAASRAVLGTDGAR